MDGDPRHTHAWRKLRMRCYRRDKARNAECWIGHHPIDYSVPPSSTPDSYEPDHYLDVKRHPELALLPENIRPACKMHNRQRKDKAGVNELGERSRQW